MTTFAGTAWSACIIRASQTVWTSILYPDWAQRKHGKNLPRQH